MTIEILYLTVCIAKNILFLFICSFKQLEVVFIMPAMLVNEEHE